MSTGVSSRATPREWAVFTAASVGMIFATGTTFASLGIVIFAMATQFGWSAGQAGGAFTLLIAANAVTQLLPVALLRRIGGRMTMTLGFLIFAIADLIGAVSDTLPMLYLVIVLLSIGFTCVCNTPGIFLIAGWSAARAPQMIGLYLMVGTLGTAIGAPIAQALIASPGGLPSYWVAMAGVALLFAIASYLMVREPPVRAAGTPDEPADAGFRFASDFASTRFLVLAAAMVATQLCVMTVSSVAPAHLAQFRWPDELAAQLLGIQGLIGAIGTGVSGLLARRISTKIILVVALLLQAAGMLLLAEGRDGWALWAFAPCFGLGWSLTCFAVTVLLVRFFGNRGGSTALATVWMLTGASAIGPAAAGLMADAGLGYGPALAACGLILIPTALAACLVGRERRVPHHV